MHNPLNIKGGIIKKINKKLMNLKNKKTNKKINEQKKSIEESLLLSNCMGT